MALESAAAEEEKKEKKEQKKATRSSTGARKKKAASSAGRQKIVWKVLDSSFKEVATFPFPQKEESEAEAARLTADKGREHFVKRVEVPMDEE
jgi:hypothetical protein